MLKGVTRGDKRRQGVTTGYQGVTGGYEGLQEVYKRGYKR